MIIHKLHGEVTEVSLVEQDTIDYHVSTAYFEPKVTSVPKRYSQASKMIGKSFHSKFASNANFVRSFE